MKHPSYRWQASWRDTWILLNEFRGPLLSFIIAIAGGGSLYFVLARSYHEPVATLAEAIYTMLTAAFLQSAGEFPHHPILQVFYFVMPIIGVGMLAQGLADFGILLFNRRARNKEWEMAVASTFRNHTILVGLGHLGYRVVKQLHEIEEQIAVIELSPTADLTASVQSMGIPVIQDDASREAALEAAGVRKARTIILCVQNDALNLKVAVKARSLNPKIKVVIRIFDDDFAQSLQQQFNFYALSGTSMAAPAFAAAAADAEITAPITVEGQALSLARVKIRPKSPLIGGTIDDIRANYEVSVLLLRRGDTTDMHPVGTYIITNEDTLAVLGTPRNINALVHDSY